MMSSVVLYVQCILENKTDVCKDYVTNLFLTM